MAEWNVIAGYNGNYWVSDDGRVWNANRQAEKSPVLHRSGFLGLNLLRGGRPVYHMVHHLVAAAFVGEVSKFVRVRHKDGDKLNNRADNLEVTRKRGPYQRAVKPTMAEKFWPQVKVAGDTDCWRWMGSKNRVGYGSLGAGGMSIMAHRAAYELHHGVCILKGFVVMHTCDCRDCVNPAHLQLGTYKENTRDAILKGRFNPNRLGRPKGSKNRKANV
jgi:hypothetical protein